MRLYEYDEELKKIELALEEFSKDGEIPEEAAKHIEEWIASVESGKAKKLDGYVNLIRKYEAMAGAANEEAMRYQRIRSRADDFAEGLECRLMDYLKNTGQKSVETATGRKITLAGNGGEQPVVFTGKVEDLAKHDPGCVNFKATPNLTAIRKKLLAGEEVPNATLGERGTYLRIT